MIQKDLFYALSDEMRRAIMKERTKVAERMTREGKIVDGQLVNSHNYSRPNQYHKPTPPTPEQSDSKQPAPATSGTPALPKQYGAKVNAAIQGIFDEDDVPEDSNEETDRTVLISKLAHFHSTDTGRFGFVNMMETCHGEPNSDDIVVQIEERHIFLQQMTNKDEYIAVSDSGANSGLASTSACHIVSLIPNRFATIRGYQDAFISRHWDCAHGYYYHQYYCSFLHRFALLHHRRLLYFYLTCH